MSTKRYWITLLMIGIVSSNLPARGWDSLGHMAVAYVADQRLTTATKNRVGFLRQQNPDFATWAKMVPGARRQVLSR